MSSDEHADDIKAEYNRGYENGYCAAADNYAALPPEIEHPVVQAAKIIGQVINDRIADLTAKLAEKEAQNIVINVPTPVPATDAGSDAINAKTVAIELNRFSIALHETLEAEGMDQMAKAKALREIVKTADKVVLSYMDRYEEDIRKETEMNNLRNKD